ncbi:hypothetical protein Hypma_013113 [Hypsizygus marmoreus]|uniref:Uncharacterized protein n=1 Tax=Hypsizygus marmoreus TaxID=39966 RepID=A0A369JF75_HYPMA|nr:hypothetical protein Hypma_013113 [Hypsizygus marmoreus]
MFRPAAPATIDPHSSSDVEVHTSLPEPILRPNQTELSQTPLLSSVDEIKAFINRSLDEQKPVFSSFHITDDDLETIYQHWSPAEMKPRVSCSTTHNLTLRYDPTCPRGVAASQMTDIIVSAIRNSQHLPPTFDIGTSIVLTGAATVCLDKPEKLYKDPDASFTSQLDSHFDCPLVVNMVITLIIGPQASVLTKDGFPMPCIRVRHYEKHSVNEDQPSQVEVQLTLDVRWTNDDSISDYMLPGRHFFVEGSSERESFATGDHALVVKRERVLVACRVIRQAWRHARATSDPGC